MIWFRKPCLVQSRFSVRCLIVAAALSNWALISPVNAQLGTGWIETNFTKRIHLDDDAGLQTFSWTSYKSVCSPDICADYTYDSGTDTEMFRIFDSRSNRSEIRLQNEYFSGAKQFEGYVTFYPPLEDESLFQIFGSTSGATLCMMRGYAANGGKIRVVGGIGDLVTGVYGIEKRINVIHIQDEVGSGYVQFYVDGIFKGQFNESEAVDTYWKYGCYGTTAGNVPAIVEWRAVRTFRNGLLPGVSSTPPGAYEAEDAVLSGAVAAAGQTGYTGTGFADYVNATGDYVEWNVNAGTAGLYDLQFRYALQSGDRSLGIRINGQVVDASLSFPATGDWSTWAYATLALQSLQAGANTVRATATGSSGPNVDHLRLVPLQITDAALKACYTFDDGTANDSSDYGHHGTLEGTATIINDAQRGKVLSLDGSGGKVELGNPAGLNIVGEFTAVAWIKPASLGPSAQNAILQRGHQSSPSREFTLRIGDATTSPVYDFGTWSPNQHASLAVSAADVGQGNWAHLAGAMTFNEGSSDYTYRLYRNGVEVAAAGPFPNGLQDDFAVGWAIGARGGVAGFERVFNGLIDDVRMYDVALCASQIQQIMNGDPVGDIDGDAGVNFIDFSYISSQWGTNGAAVPSADIWPPCSADGIVDMHDLFLMMQHFLESN